jgi:predicted PurR-regulated permease PerM
MSESKLNLPREAATALFAACILGALFLQTVPALLAGLLAFVLTRGLLQALHRFDVERKLLAHELLAGIIIGVGSLAVLTGLSLLVARFLGGESVRDFMLTLAETVSQAKQYLPSAIADYIPATLMDMRALAANALKEHANVVAGFGSHVLHSTLLTVIGWITGVLAAVSMVRQPNAAEQPAFFATWSRLWSQLAAAFKHVAWAQAKIAGINALLTGLFVMVVMPMLGWNLPYAKTLVLATFFCGLLPVVGNLISNSFICILALSVSFPAAVVAVVFLVLVHKLEYFLNARIQGHEIGAAAWELLVVLFVSELLFGPAGMVAAPVIYAFVKADLKRMRWLA